ncbi:biogenesis of lysosome-related organelles complex 1 subunit 5 [Photinus pyralis]|uniref:Biogenesis of lysosome-related organelles complex 1 subunit 5 n=1 Tax=Photinus pyralis TaxID=7054 RepID=A0A1Y1JXU6_PHOPY|nr:biogenesis of lysosome-related organelles complex 1 subunit 5 [Photinus pyralis]
MNSVDICKDINAIWTRLFDHRLFLHGEIQFTLREYEQKRGDVEVDHLFTLLEKIADIKGTQINRLKESVDFSLLDVNDTIKEALSICNIINDLESTYPQDSATELARNSRKVEWEKFVDDMSVHCEEVDTTYEQKQEELQQLYVDLQNKLGINTTNQNEGSS